MAAFYILVMDRYANADPVSWVYSASAKTQNELARLPCFNDPPLNLPQASFTSESAMRVRLPPCAGGEPEDGTIYGMNHL